MPSPVLVTGVPRSGTTWLARLLADGRSACLPGREPMNPRGRQHALGGTLHRWTRVARPTRRQALALRSAYLGLNPLAYSRYGHRQWTGPLPGRRVVVKDPFALLSLPAVQTATRARVVLVFRHPGAVLTSYRRMGWSVDLAELRASLAEDPWPGGTRERVGPVLDAARPGDDVSEMAAFWSALHLLALADLPASALVLSHTEVAAGGVGAARVVFDALDLGFTSAAATEISRSGADRPDRPERPGVEEDGGLHRFDRSPAEVAESWRRRLEPAEVSALEEATAGARSALDVRRMRVDR